MLTHENQSYDHTKTIFPHKLQQMTIATMSLFPNNSQQILPNFENKLIIYILKAK